MLTFAILLTLSQIIAAWLLFDYEAREHSRLEHRSNLLSLRLEALKRETESLQKNLQAARILRHDLRHHYRMLYTLLAEGERDTALEYIEKQQQALRETAKADAPERCAKMPAG